MACRLLKLVATIPIASDRHNEIEDHSSLVLSHAAVPQKSVPQKSAVEARHSASVASTAVPPAASAANGGGGDADVLADLGGESSMTVLDLI